MSELRDELQPAMAKLAAHGVFIGTSSWKYPGWLGQIYTQDRYVYRGKFANTRFEKNCLAEYAEVFKTVCVDAAYYSFPRPEYLQGLADQVPDDFRFSFKVTDNISLRKFPNLDRFGLRAGQTNPDFLNPDRFASAFLRPMELIRPKVGLLMFEFSRFYSADYGHGRDFVADLDRFLAALPSGWNYGVEMRNKTFLQPEYFATLTKHNVTHVFNSWADMPPVHEQMALPGSRTRPEVTAARFLLKPGRKYQEAVDAFQPYTAIKDPYPESHDAMAELVKEGIEKGYLQQKRDGTYIYINNRLEGSALETIRTLVKLLKGRGIFGVHRLPTPRRDI